MGIVATGDEGLYCSVIIYDVTGVRRAMACANQSVDDLARLLEWQPLDLVPEVSWEQVEQEFGVTFPEDYRRLVEVFGSGVFDSYLGITSPVHSAGTLGRFRHETRETLELAAANGVSEPVDQWISWGSTGEAYSLFLLPEGEIAVCDDGFAEWERHPGPVAAFLIELLTGRLDSALLEFEVFDPPRFGPSAM
ncbi:hypothetical protein AB0I60_21640 [Actinosynnema sp. NPDC050436]|uniref:hypothetical protein n=1 Tax=Actinosynnema sp. NPDC050436 TaxID=3155659 RepID=UPI00340228E7